jgi:hypothetical protein
LKPKTADKEKLKALPPPEDPVEPDDGMVSTLVVDSDDEEDKHVPAPVTVFKEPVQTPVAAASTPVAAVAEDDSAIEVKPRKKIIKKKTDA